MSAEIVYVARRVIVESAAFFGIWLLVDRFGFRDSWTASLVGAAVFTLIMAPVDTWLAVRQRQRGTGWRRHFRTEWAVERHSSGAWWGFTAVFGVFAGLSLATLESPPITPVSVAAPIMFGAVTFVCAVQAVRARNHQSAQSAPADRHY